MTYETFNTNFLYDKMNTHIKKNHIIVKPIYFLLLTLENFKNVKL